MAMPPAFARDAGLHRASEALEEEVKEAQREFGAGLTVCRCAGAQAQQMGHLSGLRARNLALEGRAAL
jgi:hypothetical protein